MTTPLSEWTCAHCGSRCGGRLETGYAAVTGPDGVLHAACSPDDPSRHPDCRRRVGMGEPLGALRGVRPLPAGTGDLRSG